MDIIAYLKDVLNEIYTNTGHTLCSRKDLNQCYSNCEAKYLAKEALHMLDMHEMLTELEKEPAPPDDVL